MVAYKLHLLPEPAAIHPAHADGSRGDGWFGRTAPLARDIQFPLLAPTSFFLVVINITDSFVNSFAIVDITTGGGPARATDLMVYKIYSDGFKGKDHSLADGSIRRADMLVIGLTFIQFRYVERACTTPETDHGSNGRRSSTSVTHLILLSGLRPPARAALDRLRGLHARLPDGEHRAHAAVAGRPDAGELPAPPGSSRASAPRCWNSFIGAWASRRARSRSRRSRRLGSSTHQLPACAVLFFWLILRHPDAAAEVRIVPTYASRADVLRPYKEILNATGLMGLIETIAGIRVGLPEGRCSTPTRG